MSTLALETPTRRRSAAAAVAAPVVPQQAEQFDAERASRRLAHALCIAQLLSAIFGDETSAAPKEFRDLQGLMGTLQHLRRILSDLQGEVIVIEGDLPEWFREGLFEATEMTTLLDELESLGCYEFPQADGLLTAYFDAIASSIEVARDALDKKGV